MFFILCENLFPFLRSYGQSGNDDAKILNFILKFIKEGFIQPMISKNLSELGQRVTSTVNKQFQEMPQQDQGTGSFVQPLISKSWIR